MLASEQRTKPCFILADVVVVVLATVTMAAATVADAVSESYG